MKLRCTHANEIPHDFYIFETSDHSLRKVEVVWRRDQELGVTFTAEPVNIYDTNDPRFARFRFM